MRYDLEKLTRFIRLMLVLSLAVEVLNFFHSLVVWWYLDDFYQGARQEFGDALDAIGGFIGFGYLGIYLLTALISAFWVYRAAVNTMDVAPSSGRITPGWSVGWFFVPIANYWMPLKAMRQTWNISHRPGDTDINKAVPGSLFAVWWCAWVLINILGRVMNRVESTEVYLTLDFISFPISIVCIIAYWKVVDGINRAQRTMGRDGIAEVFA